MLPLTVDEQLPKGARGRLKPTIAMYVSLVFQNPYRNIVYSSANYELILLFLNINLLIL